MRETISIKQAMALVHVCRRTIYNWMESGQIEWMRTAGGSPRIYVDTLFRDKDGHAIPAPS